MRSRITPVILAGGVGKRLWPLSQDAMPKQFLPLLPDGRSTFQAALISASSDIFEPPIVITREEWRWIAIEQMHAIGCEAEFVLEPAQCGTALAIAVAAHVVKERHNGSLCLVLASDHTPRDQQLFEADCRSAAELAATSRIVLFGVAPDGPKPDYGYIEPGEALSGTYAYSVKRFIEKPSRTSAQKLVDAGCLWNSGNLLFDPAVMIDELQAIAPKITAKAKSAFDNAVERECALSLPKQTGDDLNFISIDYALLEKTARSVVVRASFGWSDLGTWRSIFDLGARDASGNVSSGKVRAIDTSDSLIFADGHAAAVIGLTNVAVIATRDATLVADLNQSSKIKELLAQTDAMPISVSEPTLTNRPWGWFERLGGGPNFQVKQIVVKPGAALSLQMHNHRDEHWTVVQGIGNITIGSETSRFAAGSNVYIPKQTIHRLSNVSDTDLIVIEVQTGSYLGEDDIIRFDDLYQRA
ncbi:MAG: mannose-1-phosphate guanylyltransferase/mannose-6-phosphate isomerase [Mesorhizobium sp.]